MICVQSMVEYCIIDSCIWYIMIKFNREFKQRLTAFLERSLRLPEITVSPRNIAVVSSFNRPRLTMGRYSVPCHVAHRVDLECRGCVGFCRAITPLVGFFGVIFGGLSWRKWSYQLHPCPKAGANPGALFCGYSPPLFSFGLGASG